MPKKNEPFCGYDLEIGPQYRLRNGAIVTLKECKAGPQYFQGENWVYQDNAEDGHLIHGTDKPHPNDIIERIE